MIGKSDSLSRLTHGHPLPDHLNPAKQPNRELKNDHEAGTSGATQPRTSAAPSHVPGQVAPPSLQIRDESHRDADLSAESTPPRLDMELPPTPQDSPLPSWMENGSQQRQASPESGPIPQDPEARADRNSGSSVGSSADSSLGEILDLLGGGRFKNWDDIRAGLNRHEENDKRLDKIPFIAAHLDPDIPSPEHEKKNWTKLPDQNHPMFSDFVITQNPQYYSFRRPEQHSAPLASLPQATNASPEARESRLERAHSMPGDLRAPAGPVDPLGPTIPASNRPGMTLGAYLDKPFTPSPAGSPQMQRQDSQAAADSRQNRGAGPEGNLFPSGANSEDLDLMNAVIGNPKKWGDLDTGIRKMKEEDGRLDQDPFIAAHLDPEKKSPEHAKRNLEKLPAPDHPMFRDFLITEHPEYYSSALERRHSAAAENGSRPAPEGHNPLGRTPSLPADLSHIELPSGGIQPLPPDLVVPARQGQGANGVAGSGPDAAIPRPEGGLADRPGAHPHQTAPSENGETDLPRLDELLQENARLRRQAQAANYRTITAGVVGVAAGMAAGAVIASETGDSSSKANP